MTIFDRIYRISKAYLNHVKDRIDTLDAEAERELRDSDLSGRPMPATDDTSVDAMMRRAEERIRAAREREAARGEIMPPAGSSAAVNADADIHAADYRVLGVPVGADWPSVQSAYEKLARRCDPRRFPAGSEEERQAQRILERVNVAYEALRKRLDPTESRFARLEFDAPAAAEAPAAPPVPAAAETPAEASQVQEAASEPPPSPS